MIEIVLNSIVLHIFQVSCDETVALSFKSARIMREFVAASKCLY